ncbi:MAG: ABC transporter substrate-binding protein [Chloroflexota bacterium]|nr:ABC transporter substrate-binding protein [Chloroflexota bacterium]
MARDGKNRESTKLLMLFNQACDVMDRAIEAELKKIGVSMMQARILYFLKKSANAPTPSDISRWLFREPHTTFVHIKRMEEQGLVRKVADKERRNLVRVVITEKGEEVSQNINGEVRIFKEAFSGLTPEERGNLRFYLDKMRENALGRLSGSQLVTKNSTNLTITIKVGLLLDMTGPASAYGQYMQIGMTDFLKWFQEDPDGYGGIPGVKLYPVYSDFRFEPNKGPIGTKKLLLEDNVQCGVFWGSMTDALVHPILKQNKIPCVSLGALPSELFPAGYIFNSYFNYDDQPRTYIDLLVAKKTPLYKPWKGDRPKLALLYQNSPYGLGQIPFVKKYAQTRGVELTDIPFTKGSKDFTNELSLIMEINADAIYCVGLPDEFVSVLEGMGQLGIDIPFCTPMQGHEPVILDKISHEAEGRFITCAKYIDWYDKNDPVAGKAVVFFKNLFARYHPEVANILTHKYFRSLYSNGMYWAIPAILARGIEVAVRDRGINPAKLTGEDIKSALESIKNFNCYVEGWTPMVSFAADDHRATKSLRLVGVRDGKFTPLTGPIEFSPMLPEELEGVL